MPQSCGDPSVTSIQRHVLLLTGGEDGLVRLQVEARDQRVHPRPQRVARPGGPVT